MASPQISSRAEDYVFILNFNPESFGLKIPGDPNPEFCNSC